MVRLGPCFKLEQNWFLYNCNKFFKIAKKLKPLKLYKLAKPFKIMLILIKKTLKTNPFKSLKINNKIFLD